MTGAPVDSMFYCDIDIYLRRLIIWQKAESCFRLQKNSDEK